MEPQSEISGNPTAWNGITLSMPDTWIPAAIEQRYLLFSRDAHPALEIKWHRVDNASDLPKKQADVLRQLKKIKGFSTNPTSIPDEWISLTSSMPAPIEVLPFSHNTGSGTVCIHESAQTILVLQVHAMIEQYADVIQQILGSLTVTAQDEPVHFRMFGLACSLPAGSMLVRHSFKPGEFILETTSGDYSICITRLGPANVVLQGNPFRRWLHARFNLPLEIFHKDKKILPTGAKKRYHWTYDKEESFMKRLFQPASQRKQPKLRGAAWIVENKNKLLTVEIRSGKPISNELLETICNNVEVD